MSFCSACGTALNGAFCSSCGTKAAQPTAMTASAVTATNGASVSSAIKRLFAVVVFGQAISTFFAYLNAGAVQMPEGVDPSGIAIVNQEMQVSVVIAMIIWSIIALFIIRAIGRGSWKARRFLGYSTALGILYSILVLLNYRHTTNGYVVASIFTIVLNSAILFMLNGEAIKHVVDDKTSLPKFGKRQSASGSIA